MSRLQRKVPMKRSHWSRARDAWPKKQRKPLRPKKDPAYERAVATWWKGHDGQCEMMLTTSGELAPKDSPQDQYVRCVRAANQRPHHMKKRGKFKCDISTFMGLCDHHHIFCVHEDEEQARRLGYLTDRPAKS